MAEAPSRDWPNLDAITATWADVQCICRGRGLDPLGNLCACVDRSLKAWEGADVRSAVPEGAV